MRFVELSLIAYGAFRNRTLDFSQPGPCLHVVYGTNEAGKSTTLRAIGALLFGVEARSADAALLGGPNLRIGARLRDAQGNDHVIVRRKGTRNTLLDGEGRAIDEAPLARMLQGLTEPLFRTMFGLDHEGLRRGGEQLQSGRGDLGESLFQAGVGGENIHQIVTSLHQEADALFTPRGKLRVLNEALKAYEEAKKRVRESTTRAEAWREHKRVLDELRVEAQAQKDRRQALMAEQSRLRRAQRVRPKLAKRRGLLGRRAELGEVAALPADAAERRRHAQRELSACELAGRELTAAIDKLEARRMELDIPQSLAALDPEVIRVLRDRLGNHRKAAQDLPRRRGELRALEGEAASALRALGKRGKAAQVEALRVDGATELRINRLAKEWSGLYERRQSAQRQHEEARDALAQCERRRERLGASADPAPLARALSQVRMAGDLDGRIGALGAERDASRRRAAMRLSALGLFEGTLDELVALPLPGDESIASAAERAAALAQAAEALEHAWSALASRERATEQALSALARAGAPPTEQDLVELRDRRDKAWRALRDELDRRAVERASELAPVLETELRGADEVADRLRREAERVTRLSTLLAERDAEAAERAELDRRSQALVEERRRDADAWRQLWRRSGIEPLRPVEMREWSSQVRAIRELAEELAQRDAELDALEARRRALVALCREALGSDELDREAPSDAASLAGVAARLELTHAAREGGAREAARLCDQRAELAALLERAARRCAEAERELERWRRQWADAMDGLRLPADAGVEEAQAVLVALKQYFGKQGEVEQMRGRIEGMERDAREFARDVMRLRDQHLFQLRETELEEAADELVQRYERAQSDLAQRRRIDEDLHEARDKLVALERRADEAERALGELMRAARVEAPDALEEVERRAAELARIEHEIAQLEDELLAEGDGASLDELGAQAAALDADSLGPRLLDIERDLEELDDEQRAVHHRLGSLSQGLSLMENDQKAAEAAAEAEAHLSRVKEYGRSYVELRLAAHLLEREIRIYREQNEGPVVGRASELFERLTLRRFSRLRVGYDTKDQPILLCVDADGQELSVSALSDGTRDQLYLALRLASLERFLQHGEPMPLILDDVLIHFDDERARAALEVLGEFASHTQVLFFTHHARIMELARQVVPEDRLCEHHLQGDRVRIESAPGIDALSTKAN